MLDQGLAQPLQAPCFKATPETGANGEGGDMAKRCTINNGAQEMGGTTGLGIK